MTELIVDGQDFRVDGKKTKIISGAIHYFRLPKESWFNSLYNLKALGANTVETYIPWNMHEMKEGEFNFADNLDLKKFIDLSAEMGLYVILRPTPYICAEWEFGGLPAWLLKYKNIKIRRYDKKFLAKVRNYYYELFKIITPLQCINGGPVIMMQLENEYGSFGEDKNYLNSIYNLMIEFGVKVPIFTSDGEWAAAQRAGNLTEKGVIPTGNFGSNPKEKFAVLNSSYDFDFPLMCMEFWDGWFNRYGEKIIRRNPTELAESVKEALTIGSVNLYMFHGGTNFGFMNGCSSREKMDLPQVTSYDYDAPLDEAGNPTNKYYELQKVIHELFPDLIQHKPLEKDFMSLKTDYISKTSFFEVKSQVSDIISSQYPLTMEELDHPYGYVLYEHKLVKDSERETFRVIDASDRIHFYLNQELLEIQYREHIGHKIEATIENSNNKIQLLVENLGRVNYGPRLLADSQRKGIRTGVMSDIHFISGNWVHYLINEKYFKDSNLNGKWTNEGPGIHSFSFNIDGKIEDTYLDLSSFGKGFVIVNGRNIGRYWDIGPILSLYLPKSFINEGLNQIIIFETEGRYSDELNLVSSPVYLDESQLIDTIKK